MPRTKEPARKLAEFMKRAKLVTKSAEIDESEACRDDQGRLIEKTLKRQKPPVDWSLCSTNDRASEANRATTLVPYGYDDTTVREFFRQFERDPQNPWHWRELFYYLIESHTRKPKRMHWSESKLHELLIRSHAYPHGTKDSEILQRLRNDFPHDYQRIGTDGSLRKRLIEARKHWKRVVP